MTFWIIVSWVLVAILTAINIFIFIKLKNASQQMMSMVGGKGGMLPNMDALMSQMSNPQMQAQMKAAMEMLSKMQQGRPRR